MRLKNFEFRPGFKGFLLTAVAVAVFGYLAVWQLGRAEQRDQQRMQIIERLEMPEQAFDADTVSLDSNRYQRYTLQGRFLNDGQVILDNVVLNGKVGYDVITPFVQQGSEQVFLVNRGWIKANPDRRQFPDIRVSEEPVSIMVSLDKPRSAPVVGAEVVDTANRWNYLDMAYYRQQSGHRIPGYLLLLSEQTGPGYQRQWPGIEDKSAMHIGYAIQWAAFALIALGTYIGLSFKRRNPDAQNEPGNQV